MSRFICWDEDKHKDQARDDARYERKDLKQAVCSGELEAGEK
jgi:hypothetical protein